MKLSEIGEFGLIRRLSAGCIVRPEHVVKGIGDDCSVTRCDAGKLRLVTTDLLVERVHFLRDAMTPFQLGAKAMAVNLSDIAAMGGLPLDAYVSIGIPKELPVEYLDALYAGMKSMAARFGTNLLGGDTTGSKADLIINLAVVGEVERDRVLYRSGAIPGDRVFLSGAAGDSGAGLDVILKGQPRAALEDELVRRHLEPVPHLEAGRAVAATGLAHGMIDVSDGVAIDLTHICEESGTGVELYEAQLPLSSELEEYGRRHSCDPAAFALGGGEDYVLLVTGDPALAAATREAGVTLHEIGRVTGDGRRVLVRRSGERVWLAAAGFDHFRGDS